MCDLSLKWQRRKNWTHSKCPAKKMLSDLKISSIIQSLVIQVTTRQDNLNTWTEYDWHFHWIPISRRNPQNNLPNLMNLIARSMSKVNCYNFHLNFFYFTSSSISFVYFKSAIITTRLIHSKIYSIAVSNRLSLFPIFSSSLPGSLFPVWHWWSNCSFIG